MNKIRNKYISFRFHPHPNLISLHFPPKASQSHLTRDVHVKFSSQKSVEDDLWLNYKDNAVNKTNVNVIKYGSSISYFVSLQITRILVTR